MENRHYLFQPDSHPLEHERTYPVRPLGEVSNFVVEKMPSLLVQVREGKSVEGFVEQVSILVSRLDSDLVHGLLAQEDSSEFSGYQFSQQQDVAGLDLKMLEAAIVHSGGTPPRELIELVDAFAQATNQPPGLTYEELIYINPEHDVRTFTSGEVGRSEYDFYHGHRRIEQRFNTVISRLIAARRVLAPVSQMRDASRAFRGSLDEMKALGMTMKREYFAVFRQYLTTHPTRGLKGPSGAFTGTLPIIELLLAGEHMPEEFHRYLAENKMYFPREDRNRIDQASKIAQQGQSLTAIAERLDQPEDLAMSLHEMSAAIREFRGHHYKGVKNQIPGAISGEVAGTGGEANPGQFLRERIKIRHGGTIYEKPRN